MDNDIHTIKRIRLPLSKERCLAVLISHIGEICHVIKMETHYESRRMRWKPHSPIGHDVHIRKNYEVLRVAHVERNEWRLHALRDESPSPVELVTGRRVITNRAVALRATNRRIGYQESFVRSGKGHCQEPDTRITRRLIIFGADSDWLMICLLEAS